MHIYIYIHTRFYDIVSLYKYYNHTHFTKCVYIHISKSYILENPCVYTFICIYIDIIYVYIYIQYTPSNDVTYCCPSISPPKTPIRSLTRPQGKMRCKGTPSCYVKFTNRSPLAAGNGERFVESWESCYPFADPWLM